MRRVWPLRMRLAIFDLDGTVLRCNSWHVFYVWTLRNHPGRAPGLLLRLVARRMRMIDGHVLRAAALRSLAELDAAAVARIGERVWSERLFGCVRAEARREIERAHAEGMTLVLATGAFDFLAEPIAASLGITEIVCSRVAFAGGKCLGRIDGPETRGAIKAETVRARFAGQPIDWAGSRAYSDDVEDAPLWALVGEPVMVAPGGTLPAKVVRRIWASE